MWGTNIKKGIVLKGVYALSSDYSVWFSEAILAPFNEHPTHDLTYISRHIPISVAIYDTLSKEVVYLVYENPGRLIERFIEVLTKKQEAVAADVLKHHLYSSDFQILPGELKKQWKEWVNHVPVIGFHSGFHNGFHHLQV